MENPDEVISTEEKPKFTGRGSYLKNNPDKAKENGAKGDKVGRAGRPRKKMSKTVSLEVRKILEAIDWKEKEKLEENTLELLGCLIKEAYGDFDSMLSVAKELIKLVPKKEDSKAPKIINLNFLGNMQTQPDPLDAIEIGDYAVVEKAAGPKVDVAGLLEMADKQIKEAMNVDS
jgi:hypothetical protein